MTKKNNYFSSKHYNDIEKLEKGSVGLHISQQTEKSQF